MGCLPLKLGSHLIWGFMFWILFLGLSKPIELVPVSVKTDHKQTCYFLDQRYIREGIGIKDSNIPKMIKWIHKKEGSYFCVREI